MTGDEYGAQQDSTSFADATPAAGAEDGTAPAPRGGRPPRDPLALEVGAGTADGDAPRVVELVVGDCRLTLNPVDGSEVSSLAPGDLPAPVRRAAEERATLTAAARPTVPPGPHMPHLPLLEREEERERLVRLLSRGRSVRVTGPSGAGRSVLLDAVAEACEGLAPDGVIRLSGYRRTPGDLLQELFGTVYDTEDYRPGRGRLLELLRDVGAVVVLDDLEFGGASLEELLAAAPECAFVLSATPDVPAPATDSLVEEVFLPGLTRVACLELLELSAGRPLVEEETAWAADLWFESEGLPLRFVQAGALLRQRDALGAEILAADESVWGDVDPADELPVDAPFDAEPGASASHVPLPSLAESAAPAALLASRLGTSAQEALRFAVALGGECPHQSHLPALVGDTHGDAALGEIVAVGLAVPVAAHHRLAAGVGRQLALADGLAAEAATEGSPQALAAAQHYAWWAGHPSVTPRRVAAEAEAILAALSAARDGGHTSAAVLLARTVAPVLAAAMHWSAWERALRVGQEAARLAGEVAEEAYFLHELGVLALCLGNLDRARSELEASIALRGALADRQGTTVGRRTLALVVDREGGPVPGTGLVGVETPATGTDISEAPTTIISKRLTAAAVPRRIALSGSRRNLVAAGAGALLAAVLGTVVALGTTVSGGDQNTPMNVKPVESAQEDNADNADDGLPAEDLPSPGSSKRPSPSASGSDAGTPPGAPAGGTGGAGSVSGGGSGGTNGGTDGGSSAGGGSAGGGGSVTGGGSHSGGAGGNTQGGGTTTGGQTGGTGDPTDGSPSGSPSATPTDPESPTPTDPGADGGSGDAGTSASASAPESSATGTDLPGAPGDSGTIA